MEGAEQLNLDEGREIDAQDDLSLPLMLSEIGAADGYLQEFCNEPRIPSDIPISRRRISSHRLDATGLGLSIKMYLDNASVELTKNILDSPLDRGIICAVTGDEFLDNGS